MEIFRENGLVSIHNGKVDLRHWSAQDGEVLLLDGEWEFYPEQWLINSSESGNLEQASRTILHVPGKWNEALNPEEPTSYGYGSYRLQLFVNPEDDSNYSIRIPSVRSASEIYVNGRLHGKSGQVASHKEDYVAKNLPYSTTFTADENGKIDIVIQAANYEDRRGSGIVRSIKFGSEQAIAKEKTISSSMQLLAITIFLAHSIYALILFFLGNREKSLLFFSLLTLCIAISNLFSNDEKLFHQFFYIGYDWDFRLTNVALLTGFYALLESTEHRKLPFWRKIYPVFLSIILGTAGITMFLSTNQIIFIFPIYYVLICIAGIVTMVAIFQKLIHEMKNQLFLLLSILALFHHFIWLVGWRESGISIIHYPFDLMIAMGCLAAVWFKDYFNMHTATKELADQLQRMDAYKDQFLANTAHEFKNPLHGMINMSQAVLTRESQSLQERSVKDLETVLSVGRRLTIMVNDLLDVMSLREGNPRLQQKVMSLQSVVTGVIDMLQFSVEVKPVKIVNRIPANFPPVIGDENRVVQIVFNLLHNAVKFTNEGKIVIEADVKDEKASISIIDTGTGIETDMLKRLFRPYERDTTADGGFGLGLSISKQLVELHGGTLDASSTIGKGSTFTFTLKLATTEETENAMFFEQFVSSAPQMSATLATVELDEGIVKPNRERPKILVVDDDPINLQVLASLLPPEEFEMVATTSAKDALLMLDSADWDLVITDIMMPQISGYELTKMIRKRYTFIELPILLLTARSQTVDLQSGFLAGANDYVTKPVEALELRSRIEALTIIKKSVREQLQLEALWLQAQIQPHFLFNTLNAVIALSEIDVTKMQQLLGELSNFLRSKFQFQQLHQLTTIEEELNIVRSYVYIEQVRFNNRLQVIWDIDKCTQYKIPFLTIQPLVENAIQHGVMKRPEGGEVRVRISDCEDYVEITVEDNGVGIEEERLSQILERKTDRTSGVGLINTDQRLIRKFGMGLQIKSIIGVGTSVSFIVNKQ